MVAVADRVVLEEELAGQRGVGVQRHGRGGVELRITERPDGRRGRRAVAPEQIDRRLAGHRLVVASVSGIDVVHDIPGDADDRLPGGERLRQLDFQRVHAGHVMDHYPDRAAITRNRGLPLPFRQSVREGFERAGTLLEPLGQGLRARADG